MQNEQKTKKRQTGSERRTDPGDGTRKFNGVRDLLQLTFSLDGRREVDVYSATPSEMTRLLAALGVSTQDVDESKWSVGNRLDFVNQLWEHCLQHSLHFPLTIQPTEPIEHGATSNLA